MKKNITSINFLIHICPTFMGVLELLKVEQIYNSRFDIDLIMKANCSNKLQNQTDNYKLH